MALSKRLSNLGNFTDKPVTTGALPTTAPTGATVRLNGMPALPITTPLPSRTVGVTMTLPSGATTASDRAMLSVGIPTGVPDTVQTNDAGLKGTVRSWRMVKVSVLVTDKPAARLPSTTVSLKTWVAAAVLRTVACAALSGGEPFSTVIR